MGYSTDFSGSVTVSPPLNQQEIDYLNKFSETRRMNRNEGDYFVDGSGDFGQGHDADVIDHNSPPPGQPGLWCQWEAIDGGTEISWDGGEKFYEAAAWMEYIIEHFVGPNPMAKQVDPTRFAFLQGHTVQGDIFASGEEAGDLWKIEVRDSKVKRVEGHTTYEEPTPEPSSDPNQYLLDALANTRINIRQARETWDAQVARSPHLNVSRETFEIFLRDLEEASGIR